MPTTSWISKRSPSPCASPAVTSGRASPVSGKSANPFPIPISPEEGRSMSNTAKNYIGGEWIEPVDTAPSINPSDVSDIVGEFARGSEKDVDLAVDYARAAFPAWAHAVPYTRQGILQKIANELMARREELGRLLSREQGKILTEGIAEVTRSAQIFEFFAGECVRLVGDTVASTRPGVGVEVTREPLGIVGMICPWNFPLAI